MAKSYFTVRFKWCWNSGSDFVLCFRYGFNSESWKLLGLVWQRAVAPLAVVVWAVVPWHGKTSLNHDYVKSKNLNQDGK